MADFIKLNQLSEITTHDGRPIDMPIWISKYQIKFMSDNHTHHTVITYDNKQEINVRESVDDIIKMFHN